MKKSILLALILILPFLSGCDAAKQQLGGALSVINCDYSFNSIKSLNVGGIDVSQGLSLTNIARATTLLSGNASSIPMNFTLNLDVANPNSTTALLSGMDYILSIDGMQFTTGSLAQSLNVPSGQTGIMPLSIGFDLATLLTGESRDSVLGVVKNFIGMGDKKSEVTLQIRPSFLISGVSVPSPIYIPVSFSFGGKK